MSKHPLNPVPNKKGRQNPTNTPLSSDVSNFLAAARNISPQGSQSGRLVFALDATMSRQPTWDAACRMQAEMFDAVGSSSGLAVQLVYFRGFKECRASKWVSRTEALRDLMSGILCRGGQTQIGKVLTHTRKECKFANTKVSALVFIGDAMEEELDILAHKAGELGMLGVPAFMFQEGGDPVAEVAFREIARLTRGAYMQFGEGSAAQLAELLKSVARFARGGRKALESGSSSADQLLLEQMR